MNKSYIPAIGIAVGIGACIYLSTRDKLSAAEVAKRVINDYCPYPQEPWELIDCIASECGRHDYPPAMFLANCECESTMHNNRYNPAWSESRGWYSYRKLQEVRANNQNFNNWYKRSPFCGECWAWGSVGVWQVHPQWEYQNIPAGADHFKYMFDYNFLTPIRVQKFWNSYQKIGNAIDARLRYVGFGTLSDYIRELKLQTRYQQLEKSEYSAASKKHCLAVIQHKIPKFLEYLEKHGGRTGIKTFENTAIEKWYWKLQ